MLLAKVNGNHVGGMHHVAYVRPNYTKLGSSNPQLALDLSNGESTCLKDDYQILKVKFTSLK